MHSCSHGSSGFSSGPETLSQEGLVICEAMVSDGSRYLRDFNSCLLFRKLGDLIRTELPIEQRLKHEPA